MIQNECETTEDNSSDPSFSTSAPVYSLAPTSPDKTLLPGQLLQKYRQRAGLSQKQLAAFLDLRSRRMVQGWESNDNLPRPERLQKLIELYISRYIFIEGKQYQEARQLWDIIKDYSDNKSSKLSIYPIFDDDWFKDVASKRSVMTGANAQPFLSSVASSDETGLDPRNEDDQENNPPELVKNQSGQERTNKKVSEAANIPDSSSSELSRLTSAKTIVTTSENKVLNNPANSLAISSPVSSQIVTANTTTSGFGKPLQPPKTTPASRVNDQESNSSLLVGRQQEVDNITRLLHPVNTYPCFTSGGTAVTR
jgi:transcriptional regulator with XRE-family HTH domain